MDIKILGTEGYSINIAVLLLFHLMVFFITTVFSFYSQSKSLKESAFAASRERGFFLITYVFIPCVLLLKVIFGAKIMLDYPAEFLFAIFFCAFVLVNHRKNKRFNKLFFLGGQVVLLAVVGIFLWLISK